ncbi:MAG: hypothetical protein CM1200mP22_33910 [Dehalococcoidia bacterium]|nr:MAG: hypothetical protein CM1200mP22_33910 [Dehalococcoidia bacterium]
MTQEAQPETQSVLTPEVQEKIGVEGELIESWGTVDVEYLRRFTQAVMDPGPRYLGRGLRQVYPLRRHNRASHNGQLHDSTHPA